MDVGGWLRGLGLGQYEEKFRDNKIDADLLPRLTVDDLKDIGVSVVGDRRRLLDAIAVIAGEIAEHDRNRTALGRCLKILGLRWGSGNVHKRTCARY